MDRGHRPSRHRRQEVAASEPPAATERRLSLRELTAAADVSVRTVRYYISEGLLPPPVGAGSASSYTAGHLARLRLIARLKANYLPLREIRRQLAGLDDVSVEAIVQTEPDHPDMAASDDAAAYLAPLLDSLPVASSRMMPERRLAEDAPASESADEDAHPDDAEGETWRRVRLSDDAELLIREGAFHQRRDRVEWLINWARRVFG